MDIIFETNKLNTMLMMRVCADGITKIWRKNVIKITYDGTIYCIYSPDGMTSILVANVVYLAVGGDI